MSSSSQYCWHHAGKDKKGAKPKKEERPPPPPTPISKAQVGSMYACLLDKPTCPSSRGCCPATPCWGAPGSAQSSPPSYCLLPLAAPSTCP